jgi:hypothetical protein
LTGSKRTIRFLFLLGWFLITTVHGQSPLYSGVPVSDTGTGNNIGSANTSRNIVVNSIGTIFVVYAKGSEIRMASSLNGGQSFLPSVSVIDTDNPNVEPEIAVNEAGVIFIAWAEGGSIHLIKNTGIDFDNPTSFGIEVGNRVHMSTYGSNVYIIDVQGKKLYSNANSGFGTFNQVDTFLTMVYADVLTD